MFPSLQAYKKKQKNKPFEVKVGEIIILPDKNSWSIKIMT